MRSVRDDVRLRVFDDGEEIEKQLSRLSLAMAGQKTRCIIRAISHERSNRADNQERILCEALAVCAREFARWYFILWNGRARLDVIDEKNAVKTATR